MSFILPEIDNNPVELFNLYSVAVTMYVSKYIPSREDVLHTITDTYHNTITSEITDGYKSGELLNEKWVDEYKNDEEVIDALTEISTNVCSFVLFPYVEPSENTPRRKILMSLHVCAILQIYKLRSRFDIRLIMTRYEISKISSIDDITDAYTSNDFKCNTPSYGGMTLLYVVCLLVDEFTIAPAAPYRTTICTKLTEIASQLISMGSNITVSCAIRFDIPCINDLIDETNVNLILPQEEISLMMLAIRRMQLDRAQLLMDRGYDKTIVDRDGRTAYDWIKDDNPHAEGFRQLLSVSF